VCGSAARLYTSCATLSKNSVRIGYFRLGRFSVLARAKTECHAHKQDYSQPDFFPAHGKPVAQKSESVNHRFSLVSYPYESGDVVSKAGDTSTLGCIDRNESAIAHKVTSASIIYHNAFELQVAEAAPALRKITGRRLRIYHFRPKELNLARKNLRSLDSEIDWI
jgi:hypothetical protein